MSKWRPSITTGIVGIFIVVLIAVGFNFLLKNSTPSTQVQLGSGMFKARVVTSDVDREIGLSGVDKLDTHEALLMAFPSDDKWGIWMKDMLIPLDIAWLDSNKKVVYIETNVSPELSTTKTFRPKVPARYVLEMSAGSVQRAGIKINQVASFTLNGDE